MCRCTGSALQSSPATLQAHHNAFCGDGPKPRRRGPSMDLGPAVSSPPRCQLPAVSPPFPMWYVCPQVLLRIFPFEIDVEKLWEVMASMGLTDRVGAGVRCLGVSAQRHACTPKSLHTPSRVFLSRHLFGSTVCALRSCVRGGGCDPTKAWRSLSCNERSLRFPVPGSKASRSGVAAPKSWCRCSRSVTDIQTDGWRDGQTDNTRGPWTFRDCQAVNNNHAGAGVHLSSHTRGPQVFIASKMTDADAVLSLRTKLKTNTLLRNAASSAGVPVYAMKNSNGVNLVKALRTLIGADSSAGDFGGTSGSRECHICGTLRDIYAADFSLSGDVRFGAKNRSSRPSSMRSPLRTAAQRLGFTGVGAKRSETICLEKPSPDFPTAMQRPRPCTDIPSCPPAQE